MLDRFSIRKAAAEDAALACDAVRRSITELCGADHHEESELVQSWLANKTPESFAAWISAPNALAFIAVRRQAASGFALVTRDGELALLYVVREAHRKGLGKALLRALEDAAREAGVRELRLESTSTAREFYLRNGFSLAGPPSAAWGMTSHPMHKHL